MHKYVVIQIHFTHVSHSIDFLSQIINAGEIIGKELNWSILYFHGIGDMSPIGMSMLEFEEMTMKFPPTLFLTFDELRLVAARTEQIFSGTFVGGVDKFPLAKIGRDVSNQELANIADIVIECIDSTIWEVYVEDLRVVEALRVQFPEMTVVEDSNS